MGELLNGNGAPAPSAATETHTAAAPRLSAGLSTLVRRPTEEPPSAAAAQTPSHTVVRVSLLAADVALTGGAVLHFLSRAATDGWSTALALLAVVLGGWLGWLGLTWGRNPHT
ncbi:MAG: hypothetical protein RL514_568 [Verrucomicrobiota bacterium]